MTLASILALLTRPKGGLRLSLRFLLGYRKGFDMLDSVPYETTSEGVSRVIKRYSNRKLYDTQSSKYVTLLQIADMVRAGDEVRIIDNRTKEDKTEVTLALIISEELKNSSGGISSTTLRALIRNDSVPAPPSGVHAAPLGNGQRGPRAGGSEHTLSLAALAGISLQKQEALVVDESDSPLKDVRAQLEAWQQAVEERMRALPDPTTVLELQGQVRRLNERLVDLERRIASKSE